MGWALLVFLSCLAPAAWGLRPDANMSGLVEIEAAQDPSLDVGMFYQAMTLKNKEDLIRFLVNDGLITPPPTGPDEECLEADHQHSALHKQVSGASIQCSYMPVVNGFPLEPAQEVIFRNYSGLTYSASRTLHRLASSKESDDATAVSSTPITVASKHRGISFRLVADKTFVVGLDPSSDLGTGAPAFAVTIDSGKLIFNEGTKAPVKHGEIAFKTGAMIELRLNTEGNVMTIVDGKVHATSMAKVAVPLYVKVSLSQPGAEVGEMLWMEDPDQAKIRPCLPVSFTNLKNMSSMEDGRVKMNAGTDTWSSGATTHAFNIKDDSGVRGFSFLPEQVDIPLMGGLSSHRYTTEYRDLEFAAYCDGFGRFRVFESGIEMGVFGTYDEHSTIEVVANHLNEVEYRVDGAIRYISEEPVLESTQLRAQVIVHAMGGGVRNATWIGAPGALSSVMEVGSAVDFKFFQGLSSPGVASGELIGFSNAARVASALSVHTLEGTHNITGFVFQPMQADKHMAFGLTRSLSPRHRMSMAFAVHCKGDGSIAIAVGGVFVKGDSTMFGTYAAGDLIEVNIEKEGEFKVLVNGDVRFVRKASTSVPLAVEAQFFDPSAGAYNIKWIGAKACPFPQALGEPVEFQLLTGATSLQKGHFKKLSYLGDNWNAGTTSVKKFPRDDSVSGVAFQVYKQKRLMVGLSHSPLKDGNMSDCAVYFERNGDLVVYEKGVSQGKFGPYMSNDHIKISVNLFGLTEFTVNGGVRYTSRMELTFPLYVVVSLHDAEAEIYNIKWAKPRREDVVRGISDGLVAMHPIRFQEIDGAAWLQNGRLSKLPTQATGWNSGAVSVDGLPQDKQVRGAVFTPRFSDRWMMVGLSRSGTMMGWQNAEFAAHCQREGRFVVVERGEYIGQYGHYEAGNRIEIIVNAREHVEYRVEGKIRYVSKTKARYPLSIKTFFHDVQAEAEVLWSGCRHHHMAYSGLLHDLNCSQLVCSLPPKEEPWAGDLIDFTMFDGAIIPPPFQNGGLQKMEDSSSGHGGSALSLHNITDFSKFDIYGVSFQPLQADSLIMFGLTTPASLMEADGETYARLNHSQIDFAAVLQRNGDFEVYECGVSAGVFGKYHAHHAIEVQWFIDTGRMQFLVNGEVRYTSQRDVTFPLVAAALLKDANTVIYNARWKGHQIGMKAEEGKPIDFATLDGVALLDSQNIISIPRPMSAETASGDHHHHHPAGDGNEIAGDLLPPADRPAVVVAGADQEQEGHVYWTVSSDSLKKDDEEVQGFEFQLSGDHRVALGFHHGNNKTLSLDFSVQTDIGGKSWIFEGGQNVTWLGAVGDEQLISLVRTSPTTLEYRVGCEVRHTARRSTPIPLPLHVHALFFEARAGVHNFVWISRKQCPQHIQLFRPMVFDRFHRVGLVGPGILRKFSTSGMDWDSNAVSTNAIMVQDATLVEGFRLVAPAAETQSIVGFSHIVKATDRTRPFWALDHAIFFGSNGIMSVWEQGSLVGDFGTYNQGDPISMVINGDNEVEYKVGDQIRYTSIQVPVYPVRLDAFIRTPGGELRDFQWIAEHSKPPLGDPRLHTPVKFHRFRGAHSPGADRDGVLQKFPEKAEGWNAGAISQQAIRDVGAHCSGVSFQPATNDGHFMVGLNRGDQPAVNYKGIDFGALCLRTGELQLFENGEFMGSFGTYKASDVIKLSFKNVHGKVDFHVNGELRYTSARSVTLPVSVDATFYDPGTMVQNITWE